MGMLRVKNQIERVFIRGKGLFFVAFDRYLISAYTGVENFYSKGIIDVLRFFTRGVVDGQFHGFEVFIIDNFFYKGRGNSFVFDESQWAL